MSVTISRALAAACAMALLAPAAARAEIEALDFNLGSTEVDIYGYVNVIAAYDFDEELGHTTFPLYGLDASASDDGHFNATAQQTRLGYHTTTPLGGYDLGTRLEYDFYGGAGSFGTEDPYEHRLRRGTITYGDFFLIGKEWTTFMPLSSYPATVDFQGVAGIPFARQEQIRFTHSFGDYTVEAAIEDNNGTEGQPVYVGAIAYDTDPLLVRFSALYGETRGSAVSRGNTSLTTTETDAAVDSYGFNLSTSVDLWEGASLDAALTYGEGIASYMVFLGDNIDENGEAITQRAAYAGLSQSVGENLTLNAVLGYRENGSGPLGITRNNGSISSIVDDGGTESITTLHLNAQYEIAEGAVVGLEYFRGEVSRFDGPDFGVDRVQAAFTYNF